MAQTIMTTVLPGQGAENDNLFTCLTCSVAFRHAQDQRAHFRSDHHRYNMKRRVANLAPISAQMFNEKVLERHSQQTAAAAQVSSRPTPMMMMKAQ